MWHHYLPIPLLPTCVIAMAVWLQVMPDGAAVVLVHLTEQRPEAAFVAAAQVDATVLAIPSPGYVVMRGDTARIRRAFGLAPLWTGGAGCQTRT
jgi:hypothetical protein